MTPLYFHNPRCTKSREGLALLESLNRPVQIKLYLNDGITEKEAQQLVRLYEGDKVDLIRPKEAKDCGVDVEKLKTDEAIAKALVAHPQILQRPVLLSESRAVIGRPVERLGE